MIKYGTANDLMNKYGLGPRHFALEKQKKKMIQQKYAATERQKEAIRAFHEHTGRGKVKGISREERIQKELGWDKHREDLQRREKDKNEEL